jgi:prepilin-type N-terminal cleavage/methylation domain-containing protein
MKQKGFTLIELMITVAIVLIVVMVALGYAAGPTKGKTVSFGVNGLTESRCIEGYKFVVGERGQARQLIDDAGKGVRCQNGQF